MTTMRDEFEAYFSTQGFGPNGLRYVDGRYVHAPAAIQWHVWQAATLAERERCAKLVDGYPDCADAIRQGGAG